MATPRSNKDEIAKYIKFFAYKTVQTIVHSRSGERTKTFSKANAVGVDWFNIALPGNRIGSDIQKEVRSEFTNKDAVIDEPLWLHVFLKTSEGFEKLLEIWNISFIGKVDNNVKSAFTVYNRLALLLKSVVSVSRSLPAYRLTRRKEKDFSFSYKISSHELECAKLTDMPVSTRIGSVGTQFGTIVVSAQFQTKIDFFSNDNGRLTASFENIKPNVLIQMDKDDLLDSLKPLDPAVVEELRRAAVDDISGSTASLPTSFRTMSPQCFDHLNEAMGSLDLSDISQPLSVGDIHDGHRALAAFGEVSIVNSESEIPEIPSTPPLLSLIQSKIDESSIDQSTKSKKCSNKAGSPVGKSETGSELIVGLGDVADGSEEPTAQAVGFEDDFVLVEVRPAFAPQTGDAGQLYRECQNPPKLEMFNARGDYDSDNDDNFEDEVAKYETQLAQFDEFFRNLEHMAIN